MSVAAASSVFSELIPGTAPVAIAGVALYVASRAAADALAGGDPRRPGLRAAGHCMPVAVVALLCLLPTFGNPPDPGGRPDIAVGMVFATCLATLTLVLGIVTVLAPLTELPSTRRAWPFVLPASLLALVAGFSGSLKPVHAAMFVILGGVVLNVWLGSRDQHQQPPPLPPNGNEPDPAPTAARPRGSSPAWANAVQFLLALALSVVAGWAMVRGVVTLEAHSRILPGVLLAGAVMAPLLTLPVLGSASRLAERGHGGSAVSTLVAIVYLNLCVVLPLVVAAQFFVTGFTQPEAKSWWQMVLAAPAHARPAAYPMVAWRVDTVVLIVIGFGIIPWAMARWAVSRIESGVLVFGYAVYLAVITILSVKWR